MLVGLHFSESFLLGSRVHHHHFTAVACLSAPVAFGLGVKSAAFLESSQQGVTYSSSSTVVRNFSFATAIGKRPSRWGLVLTALSLLSVFLSLW